MSSVKKNFIYQTIYQILMIILPFVTTPYVSRVLGPDKIGEYSYSFSVTSFFIMFAALGLNNYGNRTIAMIRDEKDKLSITFWEIYSMQLATSTVVIICYILYICLFEKGLMAWIMLPYIISAMFDINWLFFGLEQFKLTVTRNTIIKLITTACVFLFVKKASDIYVYAVIMIAGMVLSQLALWPFVRKYIRYKRVTLQGIKRHFKPNVVLFIPIVAVTLYKTMDKIMLGYLTNMAEVGYYESTEKVTNIPMVFINALGTVMLPKMSNIMAKADGKRAERYFSTSIILAMFSSSVVCFGIMAVADTFVPIFYGNGYETCIGLFQILLPSCIFISFANVIRTQYLIPKEKDIIYIKSVIIGAITNLVVNSLLIPSYKSMGAAVGTLCAEAVVCIYQACKVRKEINIKKYFLYSIPFVLVSLIMYILLIFVHPDISNDILLLAVRVIIGAIIYGLAGLVIGLIIKRIMKKRNIDSKYNIYPMFQKIKRK